MNRQFPPLIGALSHRGREILMNHHGYALWARINGNGHAFGREMGCDCGRCRTVQRRLDPAPERLAEFLGWEDPPVRANTSASLIVGDGAGDAVGHVLVDAGGGVIDGLAAWPLAGVDRVSAVLLTHWHFDHISGLTQLGENVRRSARRRGEPFTKLPLYCTLAAYDALRERGGLSYTLERCFRFQEIVPEEAFAVAAGPVVLRVTPLPVVHGAAQGAVIYVVEGLERKIVLAWDIEAPGAAFSDGRTNLDVFRDHADLLKNADLHVQECNSWSVAGRGHTTYREAQGYFEIVAARRTLLTHLSGHEDGPGNPGYGWTDAQWHAAAQQDGREAARAGLVIQA